MFNSTKRLFVPKMLHEYVRILFQIILSSVHACIPILTPSRVRLVNVSEACVYIACVTRWS